MARKKTSPAEEPQTSAEEQPFGETQLQEEGAALDHPQETAGDTPVEDAAATETAPEDSGHGTEPDTLTPDLEPPPAAEEPLPDGESRPEENPLSENWPPAETSPWPGHSWEDGPSETFGLPDLSEDGPAREMQHEVLSVDLSTPAEVQAPPGEDAAYALEDEPLGDAGNGSEMAPKSEEEPIVLPEELVEEEQAPKKSDRQKFFELKFNRLDRNLTPEERQEWNSIYASYRGRSALSGTIIGIDPYHVDVWNRETEQMERQTMYCAIVIPYRVRIVIPATEMWDRGWERPDFVLQNMVGSTIDFIITKVDRESGFAIASRRLALQARRYYFAHRPALNGIGTRVRCRIMAVGPRRCLVECYGHDINLTQREMRYTAIPDLRDEYHPGQELECIVKVYDPDTDKLEISVKETESNPYEGAELRHPIGSRRQAMIAGKYGGGVFCNIPDGTVCMCNYSYQHEDSDFMVGDTVILVVQRFDEEKKQMYGKILSKW